MISKPISDFTQEQNNRGIGSRGPDGRFIRPPSKQKRAMVIESDSESETPLMDTESPKTPELPDNAALKQYIRARQTKTGPRPHQFKLSTSNNRTGPVDHNRNEHDGHGSRPCHRRS